MWKYCRSSSYGHLLIQTQINYIIYKLTKQRTAKKQRKRRSPSVQEYPLQMWKIVHSTNMSEKSLLYASDNLVIIINTTKVFWRYSFFEIYWYF